MLPGFRFLFAATLLTLSMIIFGLGAAALLRASHERFASLPNRPPPPPPLTKLADAAMPTLSMLRIEPHEPVEILEPHGAADTAVAPPPLDTLLPTDKVATLSVAARAEDPVLPPVVAEVRAEITPEPLAPAIAVAAEPLPPAAAPVAPPLEAVAEILPPVPAEPAATAKIDDPVKVETPSLSQQVAAFPEPDLTGSTPAPQAAAAPNVVTEPPLVNATPIRKPLIPIDRPAAADAVAALPDPAVTAAAAQTVRPVVRQRRPAVKRAAKQPNRRVVARPAPPRRPAAVQHPASPFGTTPFGATPFGT
ncbi:MAG: hypothetical protein JWQ51_843 [Tardiphaga sp.]|nr:hypothetical protein [Tardiphaga sp.]